MRYVGHATSYDDTITKVKIRVTQGSFKLEADGSGLGFVVYYVRKGVVVAVCSLASDPIVSHASELMRIGKMPGAQEIKAGLDILQIPLKCKDDHLI